MKDEGIFVEGGWKPKPAVLPPVEDVQPGTVYQDETGALWRASGRWLRVTVVTAAEHSAARRTARILCAVAAVMMAFSWVLLLGGITLPEAPWNFTILFVAAAALVGVLWAWMRVTVRIAGHLVAPGPDRQESGRGGYKEH